MNKILYTFLLFLISPCLFAHSTLSEEKGFFTSRGVRSPDTESVGFLYVGKNTSGSTIKFSANLTLIAPDKGLVPQHILRGSLLYAFTIFHPEARKLLTDLSTTLKVDETGIPGGRHNPLLGDILSTLVLSTIISHPTQDISIVTLDPPLKGVSPARLALERPITDTLTSYMVTYGRLDMDGTPTDGTRHTSLLFLQFADVPVDDGPHKTCYIMDSSKDSLDKIRHSHPGDSGAPVFTEDGVVGLVRGTYTYLNEGVTTTLTIVTPLSTDAIPGWIRLNLKVPTSGLMGYLASWISW